MAFVLERLTSLFVRYYHPPFKHTPLRLQKSIRLVTVHQPTHACDFVVRCTLDEIDLDCEVDQRPQFDALSYTWSIDRDFGPPVNGSRRTIVCNGAALDVQENLYHALLQLRAFHRPLGIWIDAISVDQSDEGVEEKASQVAMMGDVYGGADSVVVWLGRKTILTRAALWLGSWMLLPRSDLMERMEHMYNQIFGNPPIQTNALLHGLPIVLPTLISAAVFVRWILRRCWFERAWTLQELLLAKKMVFYIGSTPVPLDDSFAHFLPSALEQDRTLGFRPSRMTNMLFIPIYAFTKMLHRRNEHQEGKICSLPAAIAESRRRKSKLPADRLFAILSMVEPVHVDGTLLRPNYQISPAAVYTECAKALLAGKTEPNVLSLVGSLRAGAVEHPDFAADLKQLVQGVDFVEDLPSWVPDLSCPPRPFPLSTLVEQTSYQGATAYMHLAPTTFAHRLLARAAIVGRISNVGDVVNFESSQITNPYLGLACGFIEVATQIGTTYEPTGEPLITAFRKTLTAGETCWFPPGRWGKTDVAFEVGPAEFGDWFAGIADQTFGYTRNISIYTLQAIMADPPEYLLDEEGLTLKTIGWMKDTRLARYNEERSRAGFRMINVFRRFLHKHDIPEYDLRSKLQARLDKEFHTTGVWSTGRNRRTGRYDFDWDGLQRVPFKAMFGRFYAHRRLFITENGFMGTGSWVAQSGDVVMLVAGMATPVVLRAKGEEWELVGEAYCHGAMGGTDSFGRSVPGLDLSESDFKEITIV